MTEAPTTVPDRLDSLDPATRRELEADRSFARLSLPGSVAAVEDRCPVSPGHTLVVPRREGRTWCEATRAEQAALLDLVDVVRQRLDARTHAPDGYNVGFSAGEAAGQTVMHLHVHVIPRDRGDMDDPRGGVRHVIPSKGNYLATPGEAPRVSADPAFVEKLLTLLDQGHFTATHKSAVPLGLADRWMEHASAQGAAPDSITTAQLAQKVLALYWTQSTAFRGTAAQRGLQRPRRQRSTTHHRPRISGDEFPVDPSESVPTTAPRWSSSPPSRRPRTADRRER